MEVAASDADRLHIGHYRTEVTVPVRHPNPNRVRAQLDGAVSVRLPEMLRTTLGPWFSSADESVWLIRRLDVQCAVNAAWSRDRLARRQAKYLARALARAMQSSEGAVRFPNRAAYLAQFLSDLASGHAWGRWYYEPFRGLRSLPISTAVRTAVCEHARVGLAALLLLPEPSRRRVLDALTPQDARRVLDGVAAGVGDEFPDRCFDAVWAVWDESYVAPSASREPHAALGLFVESCRHRPERVGPLRGALALALVSLAHHFADASQRERLLAALTEGEMAPLYSAGASGADVLRPLQQITPARVRSVGETLVERLGHISLTTETGRRSTPFGGVFLLLPLLEAMPINELTRGWPEAGSTSPASMLRFVLLLKCIGQPRAFQLFADPLVRDVMGIAPTLTAADVERWQACLSQDQLDGLLTAVTVWQRARGEATGEAVALVSVSLLGAPAAVLLDLDGGVWRYASGYSTRHPHRLIGRVTSWASRTEYEPSRWVVDPVFAPSLREAYPGVDVRERRAAEATEARGPAGIRPPTLTRDVEHLALPAAFRPARAADLALSVVAQGVMRSVAQRLPGFADSSLPYLFVNLLDVAARFDDEETRRVVTLGRPPLQVVLGRSGLARSTYRIGWLDERPFTLYQE